MQRLVPSLAGALLLGVIAGCSSNAGLTTSSTGEAPPLSNQDPMARPVAVAWTSARARRCGFNFDPAKLRTSYFAYESKQGAAGEQFVRIEKSYDTTFKTISDRISAEPDYCNDQKGAAIKADLQRHLSGDFTPKLPEAKKG